MGFYVGDKRISKLYMGDKLIYQDLVGKKLWKLTYGGALTEITSSLTWNSTDNRWEGSFTLGVGDIIYATMDLNQPQADASNLVLFYCCTSKTGTFTVMLIGALFSDGTNTGPLLLNL